MIQADIELALIYNSTAQDLNDLISWIEAQQKALGNTK